MNFADRRPDAVYAAVLFCMPALLVHAGEEADRATAAAGQIQLVRSAVDRSAASVECYKIITPTAVYYLEKSGAGLSSLVDRDGNDWLGFHPTPGSGPGGEYRGFPNAVHQQAGNYFHPRNDATDPAVTQVEHVMPSRVTITAVSSNKKWACRYDFYPSHCKFTMTRMPPGKKYWVLYEGTPGGQYDDSDWWTTSARERKLLLTTPHEGDIPAPEWIAFGDQQLDRALVLVHHEDDAHPDRFYQMERQMTVFGFGREGLDKFLDSVPQSFSLAFVDGTDHATIGRSVQYLSE